MNADQHRKAKHVIAWLAKAENPDNPDYLVDRIKAERWPEVCAAVEANPDLSAKTIAERLAPNRDAAPITNRVTAPERSGPPQRHEAADPREEQRMKPLHDPCYPGDELIDAANRSLDLAAEVERLQLEIGALSQDNEGQHWELVALRSIVRKLVIEPADTIGPAYVCAAWLDATDHEAEVIERVVAGPIPERTQ